MPRLKNNLIANYIGSIVTTAAGLIAIPIYIHYLGIEGFGLVGIYLTLQAAMAIFDLGLSPTINREMAQFSTGKYSADYIRNMLFSLEIVYLGIGLTIIITFILLAQPVADLWLTSTTLSSLLIVDSFKIMGIAIAIRLISTFYKNAITGLQYLVRLNMATVFFAMLRGPGVVIAFEFFGAKSIDDFFIFLTGTLLLEALLLSYMCRGLIPLSLTRVSFKTAIIKDVWKFASGVASATFFSILLNQADKLVLSGMLSLSAFGIYTLASTVANAIYMVVSPISNIALPKYTEILSSGTRKQLSDTYQHLTQLLAFTIVPVSLVLCLFAEHILTLWTMDTSLSSQAAPFLMLLVIGTLLHGSIFLPTMFLYANGNTQLTFYSNLFMVVTLIPSLYICVTNFGALSAPIIWIIINLINILIIIPRMHRAYLPGEMSNWVKHSLVLPAIAVFSALYLLHSLTPSPTTSDPITTLITLIVATLTAFLAATISIPLPRQQLKRLWIR